jgi:hypothetical protein
MFNKVLALSVECRQGCIFGKSGHEARFTPIPIAQDGSVVGILVEGIAPGNCTAQGCGGQLVAHIDGKWTSLMSARPIKVLTSATNGRFDLSVGNGRLEWNGTRYALVADGPAGFASQYGVTQYTHVSSVVANPFPFKGAVVGMFATFQQMVSESEATFIGPSGSGIIIVSGVPQNKFRGGEEVELAVKVLGIRRINDITTTADLAFVGSYYCEKVLTQFTAPIACVGFPQ